MKFLVKFDLEFDLKFEISDGKNLLKFWGRTFLPAMRARKFSGRISGRISEQISEKFSETSFQISRFFSETSFSRRVVLREFPNLVVCKFYAEALFVIFLVCAPTGFATTAFGNFAIFRRKIAVP